MSGSECMCETCGCKPSKYRCPQCCMRSCSVDCVKRHKTEQDCTGVRCKTAYVALDSFTNQHLLSDYYFLEEVGRLADSAHRDMVCFNKENAQKKKRSQTFHWLLARAANRGTNLKLLPVGMVRHSSNTSKTVRDKTTKQWSIYWRVHLSFPECDVVYEEESVPESTILSALLERYLHPVDSHPIARHRLHHHVTRGGVANVEVWLEGQGGVAHQLLDVQSSLCSNLKDRTVVEFPVLYVVTKGAGPPSHKTTPTSDDTDTPDEATPISPETTPTREGKCVSDWSDGSASEEGEIVEGEKLEGNLSSLQLIANMYSDSD